MFLGHFGVALAAKKAAPNVSLLGRTADPSLRSASLPFLRPVRTSGMTALPSRRVKMRHYLPVSTIDRAAV